MFTLPGKILHKNLDLIERSAWTVLAGKRKNLISSPLLTNAKFRVYNNNTKLNRGGTLAQLGERHTHIVEATGSSPVGPTSEI